MEEVEYWIYHERQEALLCGQHALNNLVQASAFSADSLSELAHHLDQVELSYMAQNDEGGTNSKDYLQRVAEGSGNVDPWGNFSIEVLRAALRGSYGLELPSIQQEGVKNNGDVTEMDGFICNRQEHWFAIRKINGRFWNLNSTAERPTSVSHFKLASEIQGLQDAGYSVFCVPSGLPPPCTSSAQRQRGLPQFWWKEDDLVKGKGQNAVTGATDPWKGVGSGMRLDGVSTTLGNGQHLGHLTDEEALRLALIASTETAQPTTNEVVPLTDEPAAGSKGAVRIQFRLPNGKRAIRRFMENDSVKMLYSYVDEESKDSQGRSLDLKFGFPPKDLKTVSDKTIGEAALAGEAIQCRYV